MKVTENWVKYELIIKTCWSDAFLEWLTRLFSIIPSFKYFCFFQKSLFHLGIIGQLPNHVAQMWISIITWKEIKTRYSTVTRLSRLSNHHYQNDANGASLFGQSPCTPTQSGWARTWTGQLSGEFSRSSARGRTTSWTYQTSGWTVFISLEDISNW